MFATYKSRKSRRHELRRKGTSTRVSMVVAGLATLTAIVVGFLISDPHWAIAAFAAFIGIASFEFARSTDDQRSILGLWLLSVTAFFGLPILVLAFARVSIPAGVGMRLMLAAAWLTLGLTLTRVADRYARRRLPNSARTTWVAAVLSVVVGLTSGLAVPLAGLDRVAEPRQVELFAVTVACSGTRTPTEGLRPTVFVDDGHPLTYLTDSEGRARYSLPVYWDTYRIELSAEDSPDGTLRVENWRQGPAVYPQIVNLLLTFGLARGSFNYIEGGWNFVEQGCS